MQAFLGQIGRARVRALTGVNVLGLTLGYFVGVAGCGNTDDSSNALGSGGGNAEAGSSATGAHSAGAHSAGASGAEQTSEVGSGGNAGDAGDAGDAGVPAMGGSSSNAGGSDGGSAGSSSGGTAGAQTTATCAPGGALFPTGNYADGQGNALWLRTNATASTLALIARGPARAANPPQIFVIERICAAGGALIAKDASAAYRVDFSLTGSTLAICKSAAAASLDGALALAPADFAHAVDTGCFGKPFNVFLPEVTP